MMTFQNLSQTSEKKPLRSAKATNVTLRKAILCNGKVHYIPELRGLPGTKAEFPRVKSRIRSYILGGDSTATRSPIISITRKPSSNSDQTLLKFEPICNIGEGKFGKILLARANCLPGYFAVKLLELEEPDYCSKEDHWRDMMNEIAHLSFNSESRNPFLLPLVASFVQHDKICIVTPYYRHGDLTDVIMSTPDFRLEPELARFYSAELVLAVGYLHGNSIIHRDVKCDNILISDSGHLVIGDFGFATTCAGSSGRFYEAVGSMPYMAPEIFRYCGYDYSVDWWAVAVVVHCMLFGEYPTWNNEISQEENINRLLSLEVVNVRRRHYFFDDRAYSFIESMLNIQPQNRLGYGVNGIFSVLKHPYLKDLEFEKLKRGELTPPSIPNPNRSLPKEPFGIPVSPYCYRSPTKEDFTAGRNIFFRCIMNV